MPSTLRLRQVVRVLPLLTLLTLPLTLSGQDSVEAKFRGSIDTANIRENMRRLSARPHHVGSPYDKDNAEWMLARFREWGWEAEIETFDVLFPTPKERIVEMVAPRRFRASLFEPPVAGDVTSTQTDEQLATYNAYSKDGDVTAPLVFVNYGREEDYEELARRGISVQGAIAIVRYGSMWRGLKPKFAAEHGAVGCLIYSDPKDDGYGDAAVFPAGPMRNKDGVQRGSVMDMLQYPGDPLTPGVAAVPGATAPRAGRRADHHEDSGAADLVWRRAAAARSDDRARCAGGLARRAADHLSPRPGSCAGASEGHRELGDQAALRRHREDPGLDLSRRVGDSRQPSRCVGQRRERSGQRHGAGARGGARVW